MTQAYTETAQSSCAIHLVLKADFKTWSASQHAVVNTWLDQSGFKADAGNFSLLPNEQGELSAVILIIEDEHDVWQLGKLALQVPVGNYQLNTNLSDNALKQAYLAWGMGAYQFTMYKKAKREAATLYLPPALQADTLNAVLAASLVRDLINTPAEDLNPVALSRTMATLAAQFKADFSDVVGDDLLKQGYNAIHTVGRAAEKAPRLLDLTWGDPDAPKVTLVGKGVCFDSGGLDIKSASGMSIMKKDMGGAANALGLARMIMQAKLNVRLRVLIPAVENAITSNAFRPGDVITMQGGKTVEVTNTDAEGRLVLADALVTASKDKPDCLIDIATLTGAAKVATGTEIGAIFGRDLTLVRQIVDMAWREHDPLWALPMSSIFQSKLKSNIADLVNCASESFAGASTAACFLANFVDSDIDWLHCDIMGWNTSDRPGHPQGGEAMGIRALFAYLKSRF
jgi:leucyl aminopeptidase